MYISTIMIGKAVTSNSCSGTCLILSMARQPNVSDAESALGRGGRDRPVNSAASSSAFGATKSRVSVVCGSLPVVTVVMPSFPSGR